MEKEQELKEEVRVILKSLEKINPQEVAKKNGLLDFKKLEQRQEVKQAIKELQKMGVDRKYLLKYFNIAGWTIGYLL